GRAVGPLLPAGAVSSLPGSSSGSAAEAFTAAPRLVEPDDVLCFQPFGLLDHVELDAFAFVQRLEAGPLHGAVVDEDVGALVLLDEAVPLFLGEPLHHACGACHAFRSRAGGNVRAPLRCGARCGLLHGAFQRGRRARRGPSPTGVGCGPCTVPHGTVPPAAWPSGAVYLLDTSHDPQQYAPVSYQFRRAVGGFRLAGWSLRARAWPVSRF